MVHRSRGRRVIDPINSGKPDLHAFSAVEHPCNEGVFSFFQFYCEEHQEFGEHYLRVAFCKDVDTVKRAAERLQNLKNYIL